tara:strand:+ start:170 stop:517 length:348 start_codon:yes stop_codon:yes gene_type:complete
MSEPLQNLLSIYGDKKKVLLHYLPHETTKKLDNHEYVLDLESLFLNDKLILIKKSTGKIDKYGVITKITAERITIKNNNNISLAKDDYYIFRYLKKNKSKKDNRIFYEELLKSLN